MNVRSATLVVPDACWEAERACRFVIEQVEARAGRCAYQGRWPTALTTSASLPAAVRTVAQQRLRGVPRAVARALVLWAEGARVVTFTHVPRVATVLRLQASGARCVSLLPPDVASAPHADTLAFALHDLCHLDKFLDPAHHEGQVGFFAEVWRARQNAEWAPFEQGFDTVLSEEWDHVISDMNGSAVFLFAAMKMKLKMAVRRKVARRLGVPAPCGGPLAPGEVVAYEEAQSTFFALLGLDGDLAGAARATSANRADPATALRLLRHFELRGRRVLAVGAGRSPDEDGCSTSGWNECEEQSEGGGGAGLDIHHHR